MRESESKGFGAGFELGTFDIGFNMFILTLKIIIR